MPVGKPLKFQDTKTLNAFLSKYDTFSCEKDLCDFIEHNKEKFCEDVLGGKLKEYQREWGLDKHNRPFSGNKPAIDFYFELEGGKKMGVECKTPRNIYGELSRAISQILSYFVLAKDNGVFLDGMFLVTTAYHEIIDKLIAEFNLPIKTLVLSKTFRGEVV